MTTSKRLTCESDLNFKLDSDSGLKCCHKMYLVLISHVTPSSSSWLAVRPLPQNFSHEASYKPIQLRYRFYTPPQGICTRIQSGIRLTSGRFVHHHFPVVDPTGTESITGSELSQRLLVAATAIGDHGHFVFLDEHNSLEMNRTTVTGPDQNDNVLPGTVTDNTKLSEFPQDNLPPHSTMTTSSDNTTQTHHDSVQQPELKGTNVPDEVVYDVDMLSSLDSDVNSVAMMWETPAWELPSSW
ncbi:hypothetical protein BD769DRAFT_1394019 [Suillus cothurnatus]|nr:hypothetical protein BD769DRAFT_1394019 [Suillus cothurnatus]